jgi:hypothetical protein
VNRHYIFRDQAHACAKYAHRVFDDEELAIGWHCDRFGQPVANFVFPPADRLERLASPDDRNLSRSHPHRTHYWQWRATEIEDLKSGFNSLKSELGGLATGLGGLETKLGGLESGLGGLASGFDGLRTGLAGLKSELDDLRVEGERQRTQIREMLNSTSWQLTAPLRAIGRRWGWLRRLAGRTGHGSQS